SGSGKSTLLNCLAGLDDPDGGHVELLGRRMTRRPEAERALLRARHVGILLQSGNLFEHLTIEENVRLQMLLAGTVDVPRLDELIECLELGPLRDARPAQVSGGEAARAGLAVALAAAPDLLLADEPTAETDFESEERILELLRWRRSEGEGTLIVTHSAA